MAVRCLTAEAEWEPRWACMPSRVLPEVEACTGDVWAEEEVPRLPRADPESTDMRRSSGGRPSTRLPPEGGVLMARGVSWPLSLSVSGSSCPGAVSTLYRIEILSAGCPRPQGPY